MIELDRLNDQLDPTYLQALATSPFCVAGGIKADEDSDVPRWFCAIGTKKTLSFDSPETARRYLRKECPRVLDLASPKAVAEFAQRTCYHIGDERGVREIPGGGGSITTQRGGLNPDRQLFP
jgi:kynurenine 3-monooxygenase